MRTDAERLTGERLDPQLFKFIECGEFDPRLVVDVLEGRTLGVIFRDAIPPHVRKEMTARFWANPSRRHRDGEPSHYLGAYHWNRSATTYFEETAAVADDVREVLTVPGSPWVSFSAGLRSHLASRQATLRIARMGDATACPALIRAWDREGDYSLEPHEDAAQCSDPRQAGFEIQRSVAYEVCATNMCVEHERGGRLVLWNIRPDHASRRRLGIEFTGFSYPAALLAEFEELRLDIREGDIYVFNGSHVHAVDTVHGNRTNVSFLMGFIDPHTVVTWT